MYLKKLNFSGVRTSFIALDTILKFLHFDCFDFGSEVQYPTVFTMFGQILKSLSAATNLSSIHCGLQNARGYLVDFVIEM